MIPKIIHYCWFGRGDLPKLALDCIESWKKHLPEYQIKEWNEDNFPINEYPFAKDALEDRKFAFVSDVCRLHALQKEGGIYMDTDVEVLKSLDNFLHHNAFSGFENDDFVPTGIMASIKKGKWVEDLLEYYHNLNYHNEDGTKFHISNTFIITEMMKKKGFKMNNKFQEIKDYVAFYPNEYFCPKSYKTGKIELTDNSYCIHHFAKSWIPLKRKWKNIMKLKIMNIFGYKNIQPIINFIKKNK